MCDNGVFNTVVSNDNHYPSGRPTNGIGLIDELRDRLLNHNIHRPCKDIDGEWSYDRTNHVHRND